MGIRVLKLKLNNKSIYFMSTKEVYQYGTKPENPVREIGLEIKPRPPWNEDIQALRNDLQFYKDEVANLERDIKDLEAELFTKEEEVEDLEEEVDNLRSKVDDLTDQLEEARGENTEP
jgi:SMC interacting uncharacterized protein involved in chromosome segregation